MELHENGRINQRELIGTTMLEKDQLNFYMEADVLVIEMHKLSSTVPDSSITEIDGRKYTTIGIANKFSENVSIEIPEDVIEARNQIRVENELNRNNIANTETSNGLVYFSIGERGDIIAKFNEIAIKTDRVFGIEGRRAVYVPDLGLGFEFVEIHPNVENKFNEFKKNQAAKNLCLEYAGRSLLTGTDFFKFNTDISEAVYYRVSVYMEYFEDGCESAGVGGLHGFLTSSPELVEEILRIRNTISSRQAEIEKQRAQAADANLKIIEKLTEKKVSAAE